jgi:Synergist-CTERM protein sorting domain-containing protein
MKKAIVVLLVCIMTLGLAAMAQAAPAYPETEKNLLYAVTGETGATAHYRAFADVAQREGHREIGRIFRAISDAEEKHASDQFEILLTINPAAQKPVAGPVTVGTTRQNLQTAIDGETEEYTLMYPPFVTMATSEDHARARQIFRWAMLAEEVHANIYTALLADFPNFNRTKYETLYRCERCGNIFFNTTPERCPFCGEHSDDFVDYEISNRYGCNAGFAALALVLIPFVIRRRK